MSKKAFITGISGQDGSYLAEYLLELGYEVHGIIRRNSTPEHQESRVDHLENKIHTYYGDLLDQGGIERLLDSIQPDEIYNIAAQSHVRISYDIPQFTVQTNALGVLNILEAYRRSCPSAKFYQASSSEMFGLSVEDDGFQRESTTMNPVSPYGCSKVFGYNIVRNYRRAHKLHATNGILFNHESPRRGPTFVTQKIVQGLVRIKKKIQQKITLGNLYAIRDWGHAKDYVNSMWKILQYKDPDDWVIATNKENTVKNFINITAKKLSLKIKWKGTGLKEKGIHENTGQTIVDLDPKFFRPSEVDFLKGDFSKAKKHLKWKPSISTNELIDDMIKIELSKKI